MLNHVYSAHSDQLTKPIIIIFESFLSVTSWCGFYQMPSCDFLESFIDPVLLPGSYPLKQHLI